MQIYSIVYWEDDLMAKYKNIKFQYFQVCHMVDGDAYERLLDLCAWLEEIINLGLEERILEVKGLKGRLESIRNVGRFYGLNFMSLDDSSNTYKVKETQEASHIDLDEDEYIGRNTVALYDPESHVLMIQTNRGSYGSASIESYINATYSGRETETCYLRPIISVLNPERCLTSNVTKLDIRFANIRQYQPENSRDLENIINACNNMQAFTAHVEVGLGYSEITTLNNQTVHNVVNDIRANRHCVSSAKLKLDDGAKTVLIDIFEDVAHDFIRFAIPPRGELAFDFVSDKMKDKYMESQGRLLAALV